MKLKKIRGSKIKTKSAMYLALKRRMMYTSYCCRWRIATD